MSSGFYSIMKKINRLTKNEDFRRVVRARQTLANSSFLLSYASNDLGRARLGVTVNGKYGTAVERNKAKRRTRAIIRRVFDLNLPLDCVVVIRKGFKEKTYAQNEAEFLNLYRKLIKRGI